MSSDSCDACGHEKVHLVLVTRRGICPVIRCPNCLEVDGLSPSVMGTPRALSSASTATASSGHRFANQLTKPRHTAYVYYVALTHWKSTAYYGQARDSRTRLECFEDEQLRLLKTL